MRGRETGRSLGSIDHQLSQIVSPGQGDILSQSTRLFVSEYWESGLLFDFHIHAQMFAYTRTHREKKYLS